MTKKSTKKQRSIFQLNTASTVRATMMKGTHKNSKMKCDLFVLVDILNTELQICLPDAFFCYTYVFFTDVILN